YGLPCGLRLRLYGAQDRALEQFFKKLEEEVAEVSMERHGHAKQLVVFFGAASIGTAGGWGADAVLRACCKVVCRPRGAGQRRGRVVLVDEHRTTRVSSAVYGKQPYEVELDHGQPTRRAGWRPPAGQVEQRLVRPAWSQRRDQPVRGLMWCPVVAPRRPPQPPRSSQAAAQPAASEPGPSTPPPAKRSKRTKAEQAAEPTQPTKGKGKAAKAKPAPQPGRWLDRDCNAALNMQRIGESRWRPLELCYWPNQAALPAKGKEYPGLGYKRLQDKPPKAQEQQQQQQPAEAHSQPPPAPPLVTPPASMPVSLYNMTAIDIDGVVHHLSEWAGQVMLIVNLASHCGYTDSNYKGLQATYNKYSRFGFTILGFPCNQFGEQEPGSEADIKSFCTSTYDVTFPLFSKVDVNGPNAHPLFKNFFKFLVDKDGNVVKRFDQMWTTSVMETESSIKPHHSLLDNVEELSALNHCTSSVVHTSRGVPAAATLSQTHVRACAGSVRVHRGCIVPAPEFGRDLGWRVGLQVQLQFQQRTVDCLDHGLFPVAINELARTFPVSTLELHLTRGRWDHLAWGVPPLEVQPPGAVSVHGLGYLSYMQTPTHWHSFYSRLLASWEGPEPAVQHSAHWTRLTHALSGVMCTALSLAADPAQAVSMGPAGPWEAVLPQEPVCTDNLTPWLKLLPCGSKAGVAQLMSSRTTIFSSYHHSLSLVLEVQRQPRPSGVQPPTSLLRLRHKLTLVLPSELVAPAGAVKAPGLLGLATQTRCRPASCSRLHLPAPSTPHSAQPTPATPTPAAAQDPATALCSRPDLPRGLNLTSLDLAAATGLPGQLPSLALAAWGPDARLPARPAGLLFQLHAQGSGTLRGVLVWRVVRPDGGLLAPAGMQPPVVACIKQMLPWQIQLWLHTLQLTVDGQVRPQCRNAAGHGPLSMHCRLLAWWLQVIDSSALQLRLQPAAHRTAPSALGLCFTLPPNCTSLTLSAAFSKAFLTVSQQPPDAHRGVDVPAALLSLQAPDDAVTQVVSTGVLVQLATPDISMGYNVICLSSTVMAVYVGAVLTALTKRMDQATPGDLGKWVDRDCNAALNLQRAGESKWRPLELCRWQQRARLPAKGKEYPALGFKKLRERAPKAQAQQPSMTAVELLVAAQQWSAITRAMPAAKPSVKPVAATADGPNKPKPATPTLTRKQARLVCNTSSSANNNSANTSSAGNSSGDDGSNDDGKVAGCKKSAVGVVGKARAAAGVAGRTKSASGVAGQTGAAARVAGRTKSANGVFDLAKAAAWLRRVVCAGAGCTRAFTSRCPTRQQRRVASPMVCEAASLQFVRGVDEPTVPEVRLTRARTGGSGQALFVFDNPSVFQASSNMGEITGLFMVDDEGTLTTTDVKAKFVNGKPQIIEAKFNMRSSFEWDRFMRFMDSLRSNLNWDAVAQQLEDEDEDWERLREDEIADDDRRRREYEDLMVMAVLMQRRPPMRTFVLPAYKDNVANRCPNKARYNTLHSRARSKVERAFGRLKMRWRVLLRENDVTLPYVSTMIMACFILHNIVEVRAEPPPVEDEELVALLQAYNAMFQDVVQEHEADEGDEEVVRGLITLLFLDNSSYFAAAMPPDASILSTRAFSFVRSLQLLHEDYTQLYQSLFASLSHCAADALPSALQQAIRRAARPLVLAAMQAWLADLRVLLADEEGKLLEGLITNFAVIQEVDQEPCLVTASHAAALPGLLLHRVVQAAAELGLPVVRCGPSPAHRLAWREAFTMNCQACSVKVPRVSPAARPQAPSSANCERRDLRSHEATPAAASEPGPSTPPPAKRTKAEKAAEPTQPTKAAKAKPAPQPGRWLDRDCKTQLPSGSGNDVGGRHSYTMCTGYTPHTPITPLEAGDYCPIVVINIPASGH
ncbi:hypothetical protein QJQ45_014263, partial [Haematococcus lacustris]